MVAHAVPGLGDNGSTLPLCHEGDYRTCLVTRSTGRSEGTDFAPLGSGSAPYAPNQPSTVVFSPYVLSMPEILDPEPTEQAFSSAPAIISSRGFLCARLGISVSLPPHFTNEKLRLRMAKQPSGDHTTSRTGLELRI